MCVMAAHTLSHGEPSTEPRALAIYWGSCSGNRSRIFRKDERSVGPPQWGCELTARMRWKVHAVHRRTRQSRLPVSGRSLFRRADRTELDLCASRSSRRTTRCEMLSGGRQGDGKHRRCSWLMEYQPERLEQVPCRLWPMPSSRWANGDR